jgi:hypothetical protein
MQLYLIFVTLFTVSGVLLLILKRSKHAMVKKQNDGGSLVLLWIIISGCITVASMTSIRHLWPGNPVTFRAIGVSAISLGFIIRWIAMEGLLSSQKSS